MEYTSQEAYQHAKDHHTISHIPDNRGKVTQETFGTRRIRQGEDPVVVSQTSLNELKKKHKTRLTHADRTLLDDPAHPGAIATDGTGIGSPFRSRDLATGERLTGNEWTSQEALSAAKRYHNTGIREGNEDVLMVQWQRKDRRYKYRFDDDSGDSGSEFDSEEERENQRREEEFLTRENMVATLSPHRGRMVVTKTEYDLPGAESRKSRRRKDADAYVSSQDQAKNAVAKVQQDPWLEKTSTRMRDLEKYKGMISPGLTDRQSKKKAEKDAQKHKYQQGVDTTGQVQGALGGSIHYSNAAFDQAKIHHSTPICRSPHRKRTPASPRSGMPFPPRKSVSSRNRKRAPPESRPHEGPSSPRVSLKFLDPKSPPPSKLREEERRRKRQQRASGQAPGPDEEASDGWAHSLRDSFHAPSSPSASAPHRHTAPPSDPFRNIREDDSPSPRRSGSTRRWDNNTGPQSPQTPHHEAGEGAGEGAGLEDFDDEEFEPEEPPPPPRRIPDSTPAHPVRAYSPRIPSPLRADSDGGYKPSHRPGGVPLKVEEAWMLGSPNHPLSPHSGPFIKSGGPYLPDRANSSSATGSRITSPPRRYDPTSYGQPSQPHGKDTSPVRQPTGSHLPLSPTVMHLRVNSSPGAHSVEEVEVEYSITTPHYADHSPTRRPPESPPEAGRERVNISGEVEGMGFHIHAEKSEGDEVKVRLARDDPHPGEGHHPHQPPPAASAPGLLRPPAPHAVRQDDTDSIPPDVSTAGPSGPIVYNSPDGTQIRIHVPNGPPYNEGDGDFVNGIRPLPPGTLKEEPDTPTPQPPAPAPAPRYNGGKIYSPASFGGTLPTSSLAPPPRRTPVPKGWTSPRGPRAAGPARR